MFDKFEYRVVVTADDDEEDEKSLNTLGAQGWELVSAIADVRANEEDDDDEDNVPVTVFYLKRRLS